MILYMFFTTPLLLLGYLLGLVVAPFVLGFRRGVCTIEEAVEEEVTDEVP